ncbi:hypothetical protein KR018_009774 [Drosophila ironensis]|nr:hypothetical protein KR018_009774 [Drosophila ironensis]
MVYQIQEWLLCYKGNTREFLSDAQKPWTSVFNKLEKRTGVHRAYIFLGVAAFCALYLAFGQGAQLLYNIIGVLYPAYMSIQAIGPSGTKKDDTKWLIYWVTFGIFAVIDFFSDVLTLVIPFYWLVKCAFLIWCMKPKEPNGTTFIYNNLVRRYFLKHRESGDGITKNGVSKAAEVLKDD